MVAIYLNFRMKTRDIESALGVRMIRIRLLLFSMSLSLILLPALTMAG